MNYQDYQNHLKVSEYLGKEPTGVYGDIHRMFKDFWDNLHITTIGGDIFFYKNGHGHTFAKLDFHSGTFLYMRENLKLHYYTEGVDLYVTAQFETLFRTLLNDYLCGNTFSRLDWAFEWSSNDKLLRHRIIQREFFKGFIEEI